MHVPLPRGSKKKIHEAKDVYRIMKQILLQQIKVRRMREHFWTMGIGPRNDIMYIELVAIGSTSSVMVKPVEVFNIAVLKKCDRLILIHNHSDGSKQPSEKDLRITKKLQVGAHALEIEIEDHLIITERKGFFSFADEDIL
jgi:DNA repair protein RadC